MQLGASQSSTELWQGQIRGTPSCCLTIIRQPGSHALLSPFAKKMPNTTVPVVVETCKFTAPNIPEAVRQGNTHFHASMFSRSLHDTARRSAFVNFPLTTLPPCDKPVFANASIRKSHNALKISRSRVKRETTHPVVLAGVVMQHTPPMPAIRVTGSPGIERVLAKLKLKIASRQERRGKKPHGIRKYHVE